MNKYTIIGIFPKHYNRESQTTRDTVFLRHVEGTDAELAKREWMAREGKHFRAKILSVEAGHLAVEG